MVKVRKLNIKKVGILIGVVLAVIILLICGIKSLINEKNLKKTNEYKLSEIGYSTNEIDVIKNTLNTEQINSILNIKYQVIHMRQPKN